MTITLEKVEVIVVGGSTGGITAITQLLSVLPRSYPIPIIVVLHRGKNANSSLVSVLQRYTQLIVKEADDKETLTSGFAYLAPANYHLLVESDKTLSMDYSEPVNYSRPSIDITMFSIASVFGPRSLGVLLSGGNKDGAEGLLKMKNAGAHCIVQDPEEAVLKSMPKAALKLGAATKMPLSRISELLQFAST